MPKITKKTIDSSKPTTSEYFVWDDDLAGFGLRVFPSGKKTYIVQYRQHRRTRRIAIGAHGVFTPDEARKEAKGILGEVARGGDPAEIRARAKDDITVSELCDKYLADGCTHKKASTVETDKGRIKRHIKPLLGNHLVRNVTRHDVEVFLRNVTHGKTKADKRTKSRGRAIVRGGDGTARRTLGLLGGIFTYASRSLQLRTDNPVHGVKKPKDRKRSRFLSQAEFKRLGEAIIHAENSGMNPNATAAIKLLILTGCRRMEILSLKWEYVDFDNKVLRLPDSKTNEKTVPIGNPAINALRDIDQISGSPYVLPSTDPDNHYVGLQKDWEKIRKWAEIEDVHIHDLRRSFGSTAASNRESLIIIGKILGHADPKTTQIYAHLMDEPLQTAVEDTSTVIEKALGFKQQQTASKK